MQAADAGRLARRFLLRRKVPLCISPAGFGVENDGRAPWCLIKRHFQRTSAGHDNEITWLVPPPRFALPQRDALPVVLKLLGACTPLLAPKT